MSEHIRTFNPKNINRDICNHIPDWVRLLNDKHCDVDHSVSIRPSNFSCEWDFSIDTYHNENRANSVLFDVTVVIGWDGLENVTNIEWLMYHDEQQHNVSETFFGLGHINKAIETFMRDYLESDEPFPSTSNICFNH